MTALELLYKLNEVCHFQSREGKKCGLASKSELRRWIQNNALTINAEKVKWDEVIDFPIISVKLFTKDNAISLL